MQNVRLCQCQQQITEPSYLNSFGHCPLFSEAPNDAESKCGRLLTLSTVMHLLE